MVDSGGGGIQRGSIRRSAPSATDWDALRRAVDKWAPAASERAREKAFKQLHQAVECFRAAHYLVPGRQGSNGSNRRCRPGVAIARDVLADISAKLGECLSAVERLQGAPEAMGLLCSRAGKPHGALKHHLADLGAATEELKRWEQVSRDAYLEAVKLPDRQPDTPQTVLAAEVALVLERVLDVPATGTRDPEKAPYAGLLVAVLQAAGAPIPADLKDIIAKGRARWRELAEVMGDEIDITGG